MSKSAAERIKDAIDYRKLLEWSGAQRITGSGNLRSTCPIHKGDNDSAFVWTESNGMWYCHTGCQDGGDAFDFVMQIEECTFKEAAKFLADMFHVKVDWENEIVEENAFREEAKKFIEMMRRKSNKKTLPIYKIQNMKFAAIDEFRGYSKETIDWWKFRYCIEGELKDRIVIPFEDVDKRLVGITGRRALSVEEQPEKFMHRPRNLHTGFFLTGLGRNKKHVEEAGYSVKIVEGVFDAARWYDSGFKNVCAPIGVFFTEEHVEQLYKAGVIALELGFDNDKAGRNGIRRAIKRAQYKFDLSILVYPEGKDADDLTPEELTEVDVNKMTVKEWYAKYGEEAEK
ncbi:DNA primase [Bacillus phage 268TH004]|uniref:DNA primase n=1 Tax=Bacillus phage 268TH004 TaxID=2801523 RepID=A0A7T7ZAR0_9CAUD|nr:DNA primase [Bacillus phage 268TH004]